MGEGCGLRVLQSVLQRVSAAWRHGRCIAVWRLNARLDTMRLPCPCPRRELAEGGAPLSAGQKQLLALARALLNPAKVLVLGECSEELGAPWGAKAQAGGSGGGASYGSRGRGHESGGGLMRGGSAVLPARSLTLRWVAGWWGCMPCKVGHLVAAHAVIYRYPVIRSCPACFPSCPPQTRPPPMWTWRRMHSSRWGRANVCVRRCIPMRGCSRADAQAGLPFTLDPFPAVCVH